MNDYSPIACAVHDHLEHLAIRHTMCRIRYLDDGSVATVDGRIADILTSDGAEYLVLETTGQRIRLDFIEDIRPAD